MADRRVMVERPRKDLSVRCQCVLCKKIHGWRERHPQDLDKLARRRLLRKCLSVNLKCDPHLGCKAQKELRSPGA
jgi:hypothetical protein